MVDPARAIAFHLRPTFQADPGTPWRVVRLAVGQDIVWDMLPNPLARRSAITPRAVDDLKTRETNLPYRGNRLILHNLHISQQPVPDLQVMVSMALPRLRVDGVLGLDFFERFAGVYWEPHTNLVVLSHVTRS